MRTKLILLFFMAALSISFSQAPLAQWSFDDPNNLGAADFGSDLTLVTDETGGEPVAVAGPEDGDGAVSIGLKNYYIANPELAANGGGANVNQYTIIFDVSIDDFGSWHTFMQTDISNEDDGEFFVRKSSGQIGVGDAGYTESALLVGDWYRVAIVVDLTDTTTIDVDGVTSANAVKYYFDGVRQLPLSRNESQEIDNRFSIVPAGAAKQLLLFGDNDGDDAVINIAKVSLYDRSLTDAQVADLGGYEHEPVGVDGTSIPEVFALNQNYPNPFNPSTIISYSVAKESKVTLKVYNILGKLVTTLVNEQQSAGRYKFQFNASHLASGVYFYTMKAGDFTKTTKLMLLK